MIANVTCISCILAKQEQRIRVCADEKKKSDYIHEVLKILYEHGREESAPWLSMKVDGLHRAYFGETVDYQALKHRYNQIMLAREEALEKKVQMSEDMLYTCIKYVCAGNYIDFGALNDVNEDALSQILEKADGETVSEKTYEKFRKDLNSAKRLVYAADNCGEIVLDKMLIRLLKKYDPDLDITVLLRGREVVNDATLEDAREVGLDREAYCIGNGSGMPGTVLKELSDEAKERLLQADMVIAKGQGNFESLYGSGLNPYYLFLCKCELFVRRFGLPQYSSVFAKEEDIEIRI